MTHELAPDSAGLLVMAAPPGPAAAAVLRQAPRVAAESAGIDLAAAQRAAADFLAALGIDLSREDSHETPARMARASAELFDARPLRLTTFPNYEGDDELVLARDIPFRTVCEHHLLPFSGVAHVGYLPAERILGLSKLARLVEHFAVRPQTPGAADQACSRLPRRASSPPRRGCDAGGRAFLHDTAQGTGPGHQDRDLGAARQPTRGRAFAGRVFRPGRRAELITRPARGGKGHVMNDPLTDLSKYGVAVWLDDLSREPLTTGHLAGRDRVAAVTTNPSIFATAITGSGVRSPQVRDLAARGASWARLGQQLATFLRQPPRREGS